MCVFTWTCVCLQVCFRESVRMCLSLQVSACVFVQSGVILYCSNVAERSCECARPSVAPSFHCQPVQIAQPLSVCIFLCVSVTCVLHRACSCCEQTGISAEAAHLLHSPGTTEKLAWYQDSHTVLGFVKLQPRTELKTAPPCMCAGC